MAELTKSMAQEVSIRVVESMQREIDRLTEDNASMERENERLEARIDELRRGGEAMRKLYGVTTLKVVNLKDALLIAAEALDIAGDWGVEDVQVNPPAKWDLDADNEDPLDGWCSVTELASKFRELVRGAE